MNKFLINTLLVLLLASCSNENESKLFEIGTAFKDVELSLGDKKIEVSVEVTNLVNIEPSADNNLLYKGIRVCFGFTDIKDANAHLIKNFLIKKLV